MLYLHVVDTHDNAHPIKSMFVEDNEAYKIGKLISSSEPDNLVIVNSIEIDRDTLNKRVVKIIHVFLNGNEDVNYSEKEEVQKKR